MTESRAVGRSATALFMRNRVSGQRASPPAQRASAGGAVLCACEDVIGSAQIKPIASRDPTGRTREIQALPRRGSGHSGATGSNDTTLY